MKAYTKFTLFLLFVGLTSIYNVVEAQSKVQGLITSSGNNEPLIGVSVIVKNTSIGTISDVDGKYTLSVPEGQDSIIFSFIGYNNKTIYVGNGGQFNVALDRSSTTLDDLVVVGYGTQKKSDLTGSVERVELGQTGGNPEPNLTKFLHGTVPGMNIGATTTAGSDPDISIRGQNSISGTSTPLIVLDGIIYRGSLVDINPNDIASIDVLKDASAAAIYGSQASNGVVLITTKEGEKGKLVVSYSYSYTFQQLTTKKMIPLNAEGFINRLADRYLTESRQGSDLLEPNPNWDPTIHFSDHSVLVGYQEGLDNNYWDLLTSNSPSIQNHDVSIRGGGERSNYFISFGYLNQENIIKNDGYTRYSYRVNIGTAITNWLKVNLNLFYTMSNYSGVSPSVGSIVGTPPQVPYKDSAGNLILQPFGGDLNPFLQMDQDDLDKRGELSGVFSGIINVPFVPGLSYRINFSESLNSGQQYNYNGYAANFTGVGSKTNFSLYSYTVDNIVNYKKRFDNHSIDLTFVYGLEERKNESTTARAESFSSDVLGYNNLGQGRSDLQSVLSSAWKESSLYQMGRLIYSFKDRYIVTGTMRRDGFSGFGESHKFGVFPSVAGAWRITEEEFLKKKANWLNDLKLRLSYGSNGNRTVGRYETLSKIQSAIENGYLFGTNGQAEIGQFISSLANPGLKWETTNSLNFGLDFGLFNNRLSGSVDIYTSKTHDLLYNVNIPQVNGFGSIATNLGKLGNVGQEFQIRGIPVQTSDWKWSLTLNFSRNRNKVISIFGTDENGEEEDQISSNIFIGKPLNTVYDYRIIGMWQLDDYNNGLIPDGFTYGTYKIKDLNDDGKFDAGHDREILGYRTPSYRFSIFNELNYRNWSLTFLINSIQGGRNRFLGQPGVNLPNPDNVHNFNSFNFDYWTPENPNAQYRQLGFYTVVMGEGFSPYVQRNFVRLQDLSLSYNFPKNWLKKVFMSNLNIYLSGSNLITLTHWDGWDPETGTGLVTSAYPLLRTFTLGAKISF